MVSLLQDLAKGGLIAFLLSLTLAAGIVRPHEPDRHGPLHIHPRLNDSQPPQTPICENAAFIQSLVDGGVPASIAPLLAEKKVSVVNTRTHRNHAEHEDHNPPVVAHSIFEEDGPKRKQATRSGHLHVDSMTFSDGSSYVDDSHNPNKIRYKAIHADMDYLISQGWVKKFGYFWPPKKARREL